MPPRNRIDVPCAACGATLSRQPWRLNRWQNAYCDRSCRAAGLKVTQKGAGNPRFGDRTGTFRDCVACGKTFYVYPSAQRAGRTNAFCSRACYDTRRGERLRGVPKSASHRAKLSAAKTGKPNLARRQPPTSHLCLSCGDTFALGGRYRYLAGRQRFCDTRCWYAYVRTHPEAHGSFRGGREPYYGPNWREQARRARERDGHACRDCGHRQRRPLLDVHHIRGRRDFGGNHVAANDLANLVSLCKSCHTKREREADAGVLRSA